MKHKLKFHSFQFYWPGWYSLPWFHNIPADEFGPAEFWCGVGPLQFRFEKWRVSW